MPRVRVCSSDWHLRLHIIISLGGIPLLLVTDITRIAVDVVVVVVVVVVAVVDVVVDVVVVAVVVTMAAAGCGFHPIIDSMNVDQCQSLVIHSQKVKGYQRKHAKQELNRLYICA